MGCASSSSGGGNSAASSGSGGILDKVLDLAGLQTKPAMPQMPEGMPAMPGKAARKVTLRIHAGSVLNTDTAGRSLSLVAKLYKLKAPEAFLQAPYLTFSNPPDAGGRSGLAEGVVEVREIVLTPGQKYEVVETLPIDVNYIAVVGLFRAPDDRRWRFAFDVKDVAKTGITMGAHGCAWSVSEGQPVNAPPEALRLAGVRCR
jgi:type VI secretion system protein VasD